LELFSIILNIFYKIFNDFWVWYLGGLDSLLYILIIFILIDCITTIFCAIYKHNFLSKKFFRTLINKFLILILVGFSNLLDKIMLSGSIIRIKTIIFYTKIEGLIILQNISRLGLPIPDKLKKIIKKFHNK